MDQVLPILIESAEGKRDRSAAALRQANQVFVQAKATQERLVQFRAECLARSPAGSLGQADAQSLANYQRFITRLDEAITMQQHQVNLRGAQVDVVQKDLTACQQRLLAFQTLKKRRALQVQAKEARRGQRESDEFAARAFAREGSATSFD